MKTLIKNSRVRRILSLSLMILGGVLIFFAPEGAVFGGILLATGLALEIAGVVLGHQQ